MPAPSESSPSARRRATTSPTCSPPMRRRHQGDPARRARRAVATPRSTRLQPENGGDTLYTRLRGGRDVKISKKAVIARSPAALAKLRADGCDVLVYACTGEFPPMPGDENVLFPSRVLNGLATGLLPRGRLGLLIPLAEQAEKLALEMGAAGPGGRGRGAGAQRRCGRGRRPRRGGWPRKSPISWPWTA